MDKVRDSTVLVTGGLGFVGARLVARLAERGAARVVALDSYRAADPGRLEGVRCAEIVRHDLGTDDPTALDAVLEGVDFVFHLAAEKHDPTGSRIARTIATNVVGTHSLLEVMARAKVGKIVFASSLYAYGRTSGPPFVESETPQPRTVYGLTKLAGEQLVRSSCEASGCEHDCVRYLFVYGPHQLAGAGRKSVVVSTFERLERGEPPVVNGDGEQALDYVYVDDAVEATIAVLERPGFGDVFNVGSGRATTVNDLVATMIRVSGRRITPVRGPADRTAGTRRVGDVRKIADVVGWRATTSLEEGLAETWRWMAGRRR